MAFDVTSAHPEDALSGVELELYHLIMAYRAANGLDAIPLSVGLTTTAGRHAADTVENIWEAGLTLPAGANLHSWSDAPYYGDHRAPDVMWSAPERIGTSYTGNGYEISAAGYGSIEAALAGWQSSSGHNTVILNQGGWAALDFNAIGIGVLWDPTVGTYGGRVYHVWFGTQADPDGAPDLQLGDDNDSVTGTLFADDFRGGAGDDRMALSDGNDRGQGEGGRDSIEGGAGRDRLWGGQGRDRIDGGTGNDVLSGDGGGDTFLFNSRWGRDEITGLDGGDRVRVLAQGEVANATDLADALTETAEGVLYDHLGDGRNTILFVGTDLAQVTPDLFGL